METLLSTVTFSSLLFSTIAINFKNNACTTFFDYHIAAFSPRCYVNPDVLSDVENMVLRNRYDLETHSFATGDGYILNLFRISPKNRLTKINPIFIQHGITMNSGCWVSTRRSIVFHFADLGYEVWLGNLRGTVYSNKHENLTVHDLDYWSFNLDILTEQDLRTQLNFVAQFRRQKIHYIGHSMGTTLVLMFISTFPKEANEILQSVSLLSPVWYLHEVPFLAFVDKFSPLLIGALKLFRMRGFFYHDKAIHILLTTVCKWFPEICYFFMSLLTGKSTQFLSEDLLIFFTSWPSGSSLMQFQHYKQIFNYKNVQKFDYGPDRNLEEYGCEEPPVYSLEKIELPICLFYGENDSLYNKENIQRLYNEIGSTKKCKYSVRASGHKYYNHIDFIYGKSIEKDLYSKLECVISRNEF